MDGTSEDGIDSFKIKDVYVKKKVLAALVFLKSMSNEFKLLSNGQQDLSIDAILFVSLVEDILNIC
ncbi:hypothetical protein C0J52_19765, partial [Blattella germanica]